MVAGSAVAVAESASIGSGRASGASAGASGALSTSRAGRDGESGCATSSVSAKGAPARSMRSSREEEEPVKLDSLCESSEPSELDRALLGTGSGASFGGGAMQTALAGASVWRARSEGGAEEGEVVYRLEWNRRLSESTAPAAAESGRKYTSSQREPSAPGSRLGASGVVSTGCPATQMAGGEAPFSEALRLRLATSPFASTSRERCRRGATLPLQAARRACSGVAPASSTRDRGSGSSSCSTNGVGANGTAGARACACLRRTPNPRASLEASWDGQDALRGRPRMATFFPAPRCASACPRTQPKAAFPFEPFDAGCNSLAAASSTIPRLSALASVALMYSLSRLHEMEKLRRSPSPPPSPLNTAVITHCCAQHAAQL
mmetsp:Transcript_21739/g.54144  ORF Transcript_21739/g.54144 Transcript_21739/m.54144 type:complete len:378 (+) Transcript_21739:855-1988(+)